MRWPIRVAAAATLDIDGVTVQPDHRRTIPAGARSGEWQVDESPKHRPLIEPANLPGMQRPDVEMLR
jgi:hypothetical protein